jgi:hypothetical protein
MDDLQFQKLLNPNAQASLGNSLSFIIITYRGRREEQEYCTIKAKVARLLAI